MEVARLPEPVRATYVHPGAEEYARPGGPWDIPSLDALLSRHDRAEEAVTVAELAGGLRERAVEPGDVVCWQAPNSTAVVWLYRACWRIGAIAAPIHHSLGRDETAALVGRLAPRVQVAWGDVPLRAIPGTLDFDDIDHIDGRGEPAVAPWPDPAALAAVLFTSGSSGAPKGVLHTQRSLGYKALLMADVHGLTTDDAALMPAPLAHISGLLNGITLPGVVPFKSVLMARWDPEHALALIEQERVTFMVGPPTFFVSLMSTPGFSSERVASLRLVSSGGAGVTEAFVDEAESRLGCVVKRTYGSTEAPTIATSRSTDVRGDARRRDGRAVGAVRLRVSDPEHDTTKPAGEAGELLVQGPELFSGYLGRDDTAAAIRDGWFRTGDLATIDADGWLQIVGRIKDLIIRGGENIAAAEVEAVLERHPAVSQAVAVGYPDRLMGERVCAFVVAPSGDFDLDACRAWFAEQGMTPFKTPERVAVVDALPLLATGKPDRAALRALAAATPSSNGA
jgi:acyl-CoA synthetase (AMP-forming)/AMP-acid ligase II